MLLDDFVCRDALIREPRLKGEYIKFEKVMNMLTDFAYISGSVCEGFANKTSDVDIYIIIENPEINIEGINVCHNKVGEQYYVQLNLYSKKWFVEQCSKLNMISLEDNNAIMNLNSSELTFYYRVAIAIPLINDNLFYSNSKNYCKEKINRLIEKYYTLNSIKKLQYAKLFVDEGNIRRAYFYALDAFELGVDAFLARNGQGYMSRKFRYLKLARILEPNSELHSKIMGLQSLGNKEMSTYIDEVCEFCQEIEITTNIKHQSIELIYALNTDYYYVNNVKDYLIQDKMYSYEINPQIIKILNILERGNLTESQIISESNVQFNYSSDDTRKYIQQLEKYGLIKLI